MEKLRVLIINDYQKVIGGVERYLDELVPILISNGITVSRLNIEDIVSEQNFLPFRLYQRHTRKFTSEILTIINQVQPHLIHIHNNKIASHSVFSAAKESGLPIIQSIHDMRQIQELPRKSTFFNWLISYSNKNNTSWQRATVNTFVSHSKFIELRLKEKYPDKGIQHVPLFVNHSSFSISHDKTESNVLLFVGRLEPHKGVDFLIDTFKNSSLKNDFQLEIHGNGSLAYLCQQEAENSDKISFYKDSDHDTLLNAYKNAFCTIVPSVWDEPFGLVGIESQACGTPVIAADVGGIYEWCIHKKTGFLFESENAESLTEQVYYLKSHPDVGKMCVGNALERLENYFSIENHLDILTGLYHNEVNL